MNSVFSLKVIKASYQADRPYESARNKELSGSGFIIDIEKGLVVTNAHLVGNAITIIGRSEKTGKKDISLELLGICREKDLAMCKIVSSDHDLIRKSIKQSLSFGDSMNIKPGDPVTTLGYPMDSNNIKITTGVVSGFEVEDNDIEDSYEREPCYIQISAPINSGNSGGPLLNHEGKVIGIITSGYKEAQNVGFAIPSRTFLAIYSELLSSEVVKMPTLSLNWCRTNRDIMKKQTGTSSTYGIYVRKINPNSCLDKLEKGDIIRRLDYMDIFWKSNGEINNDTFSLKSLSNEKKTLVTVFIDRYGICTSIGKLKNPDETDEEKIEYESNFTDRKLTLSEVVDMIPIGSEITLNMCRNGSWYKLKTSYVFMPSEKIPNVYSRITPYDYEIVGGLCLCNLDEAHIDIFEELECHKDKFKRYVVITKIFPGTSVYKTQVFQPGYLIKSFLGYNEKLELIIDSNRTISSLDDIRHILHLNPHRIQITTTDDFIFMFSVSEIVPEDKKLLSDYRISHKYLL